MAREFGEAGKWDLAMALYWEGCIALRQIDYENGKSLIQEGLSIFREVGDNISTADTLHALGQLESNVENYEAALEYYRLAKDIKAEYGRRQIQFLFSMTCSPRSAGLVITKPHG